MAEIMWDICGSIGAVFLLFMFLSLLKTILEHAYDKHVPVRDEFVVTTDQKRKLSDTGSNMEECCAPESFITLKRDKNE